MWKRVWETLDREQRLLIAGLFALMIVAAFFEVLGLGLILPFIQLVADPSVLQTNENIAAVHGFLGSPSFNVFLYLTAFALVSGFVVKGLILVALSWVQAWIVLHKLYIPAASDIFSRFLHQPYVESVQQNSAETLRTITRDVMNVYGSALSTSLRLVAEAMVVIALAVLLLITSPFLTLITAGLLGITAWFVSTSLRKRLIAYGRQELAAKGQTFKWVQEGIGATKDIKILGSFDYFLAGFERESEVLATAGRKSLVAKGLPRSILETTVVLALVVAICFSQANNAVGGVDLPELIFLGAAAARITPSFTRMVGYINTLHQCTASLEVVAAAQDIQPEADEVVATQTAPLRLQQGITFENVSFGYPGVDTKIIDDVSLAISKGESVAFVGPTGAGKTTIIDLFLGLLQPDDGAIFVDGCDVAERRYAWRRNLGYVPQDVYLADMTVRDNVVFGQSSEVEDERVWSVLEDAQVASFIRTLPSGIDTLIGERGVRFSGGQRQRLGIARALFANPDVLVFDEATSALDNETEARLTDAINRLGGTKTLVIIAHRLSTVRQCDRIFLLVEGSLRASGSYDELLRDSPEFRRLAQQGEEEPDTASIVS